MWACRVGDGLYVSVAVLVGIAEHPSVVEVLQEYFARFLLFLRLRTLDWGPFEHHYTPHNRVERIDVTLTNHLSVLPSSNYNCCYKAAAPPNHRQQCLFPTTPQQPLPQPPHLVQAVLTHSPLAQ